jgi:hypothetical protein
MQWNVLSLKEGTYQAIWANRPHLIFLQETRAVMKNTSAYNYISKCREKASSGGGIAIGIDRILNFRDLSHLIPKHLYEALEMVLYK